MRLAFYTGTRKGIHGLLNRTVRWWTRGPFSHCELIFTAGMSASASGVDHGVRFKVIQYDPARWVIIPINGDEAQAMSWFVANMGKGYDYLGLFGFLWRPYDGRKDKFFCSEAVAAALGFPDAWRFDPNTLAAAIMKVSDDQHS